MTPRPAVPVTANLFGIPFGLAGLAQCWSVAHGLVGVPAWPGRTLWVLSALVYVVLLVAYLRNVVSTGRARTETSHPTFGPFTALVLILPMLYATALPGSGTAARRAVFLVLVVLVALYGGWLSGQWIVQDLPLDRWHPGYFLPTVAGPLLGTAGLAAQGHERLALVLLGYGVICWILLGSIILVRLFTGPPLPTPLVPTLAIEVAPPVVAGSAWFALNGGRADTVACLLAGYALLMVLVQLRLVPLYARLPFVAGVWAFSFSYAAVVAVGIRWLVAADVAGRVALTYALLGLVTLASAALTVRTVVGLRRGTFLPRPPERVGAEPAVPEGRAGAR